LKKIFVFFYTFFFNILSAGLINLKNYKIFTNRLNKILCTFFFSTKNLISISKKKPFLRIKKFTKGKLRYVRKQLGRRTFFSKRKFKTPIMNSFSFFNTTRQIIKKKFFIELKKVHPAFGFYR
jgi:hypothetical protein